MRRILCGTPHKECFGIKTEVNKFLVVGGSKEGQTRKTHVTSEDAFKCYARFLKSQGYEQLGPREFKKDGPILILDKKSKFGMKLRGGKTSEDRISSRAIPKRMGRSGGII